MAADTSTIPADGLLEKDMRESIKAELENNWGSWRGLDKHAFRRACFAAGITLTDANWLWDRYTTKVNDGHMTWDKDFAVYYPFTQ